MRLVQVEKLCQLTFFPRLFPVNCYFVEEDDGLTLVDAAMPFSAQAIRLAADKLGRPIKRIVLTHAHSDHIGALDALKGALPDITVYVSRREARLLAGDRTMDSDEAGTSLKGGIPRPGQVRTQPDVLLEEGDRIGSLIAFHAPGHTPGLMAFYDERNGNLLAGDAFQTRNGVAVSGQLRLLFPFPALATWNKQAALASARKLAALKPSRLAIGHGNLLERPGAALQQAIAAATRNLSG